MTAQAATEQRELTAGGRKDPGRFLSTAPWGGTGDLWRQRSENRKGVPPWLAET